MGDFYGFAHHVVIYGPRAGVHDAWARDKVISVGPLPRPNCSKNTQAWNIQHHVFLLRTLILIQKCKKKTQACL